MTLTTDQLKDASRLSETGRKLLSMREKIISRWETEVRSELAPAAKLPHPILIDTIPAFVDNFAEALTKDYPREGASFLTTVAQEHGGERARLSQYSLDQLIREHQILRSVMIQELGSEVDLSKQEKTAIYNSFDLAIREAVTAFALTQANIREQFVATLSHDLKNPLGVSSMAAELILMDPSDPKEVALLAAKIVENNARIDRMIRDLLDVLTVTNFQRLNLDLSEFEMLSLVKDVISNLTLSYGKRFVCRGEPIVGWWSRTDIERAIENMASNAVKYGDATTPITISIQTYHERIAIAVHNMGRPIPAEEQEVIFQPFRRSESARKEKQIGWGIGLPLVRAVAESHGGSIGVDSAGGRGTTFTIDMPLDARPYQNAPTLESGAV